MGKADDGVQRSDCVNEDVSKLNDQQVEEAEPAEQRGEEVDQSLPLVTAEPLVPDDRVVEWHQTDDH